jgi:iron(III) transport system ATP-binding protein
MITGQSLNKTYRTSDGRTVNAMKDVAFSIDQGRFYVLLGPSGSGKTTTLRSIAGLEEPDAGEIRIDNRIVFSRNDGISVPPEERPIAMVFQSYALWPHMNVTSNITFPLRRGIRRTSSEEINRRLERALTLLNLTEQAARPISTLSGGQQQRVALARALALEPAVLLMDEPLSNLDAKLRAQLRVEIKQLTRSIGITTVYVTHDQTEAMVMGDRIAVMDRGEILQEGTPTELYRQPRHLTVAKFLGEMNFLKAVVETSNGRRIRASTAAGMLDATAPQDAEIERDVLIGFRPEDATMAVGPGENVIEGAIVNRYYLGDVFLYDVSCASSMLQVKRPKNEKFELGQKIYLHVPAEDCTAFSDKSVPVP